MSDLHVREMINLLLDYFSGKPLVSRSPQWSKLCKAHIILNPNCAVCGYARDLQVHHIIPVHVDASMELDPHNLITLGVKCPTGNHHLLFGHLGKWASFNIDVVQDADHWLDKIVKRP